MTEEELRELYASWVTYAGPLEPVIRQVRDLMTEVQRLREESVAYHAAATSNKNLLDIAWRRIEELEWLLAENKD